MKKYIDMEKQEGCISLFVSDEEGNPIEIIQAGTTINSMPIKYKNEYKIIEDINIIFLYLMTASRSSNFILFQELIFLQ